jgi:hypothetical protein
MWPQSMGAYTTVFAACSPRDQEVIVNGNYIFPPNVVGQQHENALDEKKQRDLADLTERILTEHGILCKL